MTTYNTIFSLVALAGVSFAQDAPPPAPQSAPSNGGWRRMGDSAPPQNDRNYSQDQAPPQNQANYPPPQNYSIPPQVTIRPGTYLTVRINQPLSSDRNQVGDAFSATLVRPVVVDGIVVAERGQVLGGRVAEVQKAGRVSGVSRLGVQLTELTAIDGQQLPVQAGLITRNGETSYGRDATAIGVTTATGAAIGAGVNGGMGAGIGAAAGAVASTVGVLLTRGRPTELFPETVLTFRLEAPVIINTERSAQAFRYVAPHEYDRPEQLETRPQQRPPYAYGPPRPYYYGGYYPPYPYPYYPYYWGPSFVYFGGGRFYGGGFRHR
jgi:hypothetical protein